MKSSQRRKIKFGFNLLCAIIVAFMVSYWLYKYEVEDRDITVVDYSSFEEAKHVRFPLATICLRNPFIDAKLKQFDENITKELYIKYLKGEYFEDQYQNIDYRDVTLNLADYFTFAWDRWRNESKYHNSSIEFDHKEIWSGFPVPKSFLRCFVLKENMDSYRHVNSISLTYDEQKLFSHFSPDNTNSLSLIVAFHYPGQLFLSKDVKIINVNPRRRYRGMYKAMEFIFHIQSFEVLKRRHTKHKECLEDTYFYDKIVLDESLKKKSCRRPFHKEYQSLPLCKIEKNEIGYILEKNQSRTQTKDGILNVIKLNMLLACERISQIRITTSKAWKDEESQKRTFSLKFNYPQEVKIITQSKEVDIHSLIGNIGAYLGLFMGMVLYF